MFNLTIVTLEKPIFDGEVISLMAPGEEGYLELLQNHAPIIVALKHGKLRITDKEGKHLLYAVSGGFLEMSHNKASLIADSVELASEIDTARAETALEKAESHLTASQGKKEDLPRAKDALLRAKNRLEVSRQFKEDSARHII